MCEGNKVHIEVLTEEKSRPKRGKSLEFEIQGVHKLRYNNLTTLHGRNMTFVIMRRVS